MSVKTGNRWILFLMLLGMALVSMPSGTRAFGDKQADGQRVQTTRTSGRVVYPINFERAFEPYFVVRDLDTLIQKLQANEQQRPVLASLFADHLQAYQLAAMDFQSRVRDASPRIEESAEARQSLYEAYRRDLQSLTIKHAQESSQSSDSALNVEELIQARTKELEQSLRQLQHDAMAEEKVQQQLRESIAAMEAWQTRKRELITELQTSIGVLLDPVQVPAWESLQREFRRTKSLRRVGVLAGESIDLMLIADRVCKDQPQTNAVAATLVEYELEIDTAVRQRDDALEVTDRELDRALLRSDREQVRRLVRDRMRMHETVRSVNLRSAERIANSMTPSCAEDFRIQLQQVAFPRVYRRTVVERQIQAAEELSTVAPELRALLQEMATGLKSELAVFNAEIARLWVQHEMEHQIQQELDRLVQDGSMADSAAGWMEPGSPLHSAFLGRARVEEKYVTMLGDILTPEQWQQLPRTGHEAVEGAVVGPESGGSASQPNAPGKPATWTELQSWIRVRFDADKDGQLDDGELEAAVQYLSEHPDLLPG